MNHPAERLPVEAILPQLDRTLAKSPAVVLQAPPGSGKTTRVPRALLDAAWLSGQRILMLEPRRLAAVNAANYIARSGGEPVGATVGYAIRFARRCGPETRLEIMTEGVLTRRLQNDPELGGVGLVVFDEFHERSLQADLALALCRDIQQGLRPELRLLIMSATLDTAPLARLLDNCPVVTAAGRTFPVAVTHLADAERGRIAAATAAGIRQALRETAGDILAFLPGTAEIRRCQGLLQDLSGDIDLRPLTGQLPFAEQEAAILPGPRRRVVLATNVAETSLTIEGIETVVDSGWERRPLFDAARGMSRLQTLRISRASADQRTGRAGRLGPGRCYRLWSKGTDGAMLPFAPPEIRQADLLPLAFELALWGVPGGTGLAWSDPPPTGHLAAAHRLLVLLDAMDAHGRLTPLAQRMAGYPTHPRLARLLTAAVDEGRPGLGSDLVALLEERDLLTGSDRSAAANQDSDLLLRLDLLRRGTGSRTQQARRTAAFWRKRLGACREPAPEPVTIGRLLALAYPDRIARRRSAGSRRYLLRDGQGALLGENSVVRNAEWLVAVEIVGRKGAEGEIRQASALDPAMIEEMFGSDQVWRREVAWDPDLARPRAREVRRLDAIALQERPTAATADEASAVLLEQVRRQGVAMLPWTPPARRLLARVRFLRRHLPELEWPDWSDQALLDSLENWLAPWLQTAGGQNELAQLDLHQILKNHLGWQRRELLDRLAPDHLQVPSGARIRLDYPADEAPVLAVKLQEMFGLAESPRLAENRVPVRIHLLSPAGRPLAVTSDLYSFWNQVYPEVRREMQGRYPKHPWPEDPWQATATRKAGSQGPSQ
ncbi:MAG TPA: ATP-dependent helicase HrpB [Desulfuromonadales bacterium]|nr:ATP-dependent helicase HrpB [Desulfuromonadales bacterium]